MNASVSILAQVLAGHHLQVRHRPFMGTGASVLRDNPIGCSFKGGLFGYVIDLPPDHWVWHREQYNYFEYSKLSDAPSSEIDSLLDFVDELNHEEEERFDTERFAAEDHDVNKR